jgi:hypothetical protein
VEVLGAVEGEDETEGEDEGSLETEGEELGAKLSVGLPEG